MDMLYCGLDNAIYENSWSAMRHELQIVHGLLFAHNHLNDFSYFVRNYAGEVQEVYKCITKYFAGKEVKNFPRGKHRPQLETISKLIIK